jgi:hypothetical protein
MHFLLHIAGIITYFVLYTLMIASIFGIAAGFIAIFANSFLVGMPIMLGSILGAALSYHTIDEIFEVIL